ncbi:transporter substrate-binding domain-containing protein [Rhizobium deserti]|uniref:Transporter substrate-binding domain-containing protein n=1 Tax=Rhizobium deserti TaxID=2547961 RepID=A0A4V3APT2_9HYPH|nr:transporter substrate-binding domain-containing protein [Rhizobium deserti]TDK39010.1 transporter substrate-binding domain-containing protein [Rhizobium deserti]
MRWISLLPVAFLALASPALSEPTHADAPIALTTESYPPFSYREADGTYRGVGIDQVTIIMREADLPYTIEIMPWARAITLAETQPRHCVFAAARTPDREPRFKWVVPLFIDVNILVRHAASAAKAATMDEARQFTIGTHREDYTEDLLKRLDFPKIDLSPDLDATLRKLLGQRIDMMPMSEGVYAKLKAEGMPIERVMAFSQQQLGMACNKDVPDAEIARMQTALDALIRQGDQKVILSRYGIATPQ